MDNKEELLACFLAEIDENSQKKIMQLRQEMEAIKMRTEQEIIEEAKEQTHRWFVQEEEIVRAEHAVAMSHLNDDNHRRLMEERDELVQGLFDRVIKELKQFCQSDAYEKALCNKLQEAGKQDLSGAVLLVSKKDEALLPKLIKALGQACTGDVDETIVLGGYRLVLASKGRLIDETYDNALQQARENFLQTSGLTIC